MPSLGAGEMIVIFVLVLVLFGPNRLPELARGLGKGMREVRKITSEFQSQLAAITDIDDEKDTKPAPPATAPPAPPRLDQLRTADMQWTPHEDALPLQTPQETTPEGQSALPFDASPTENDAVAGNAAPPDTLRKDSIDA